jgi:siroheme decarboxylase
MQEMDQRDQELLAVLQEDIPLVSTPFAFIGQTLDMSEKEVLKRTDRLRREGAIRHLGAQFDVRALGYRSSLVAARVDPDRIDDAAAVVNAHPGVTQNYRRNNDLNLWFTIHVSPFSRLGLDETVAVLQQQSGCEVMRPLQTLRTYKGGGEGENPPEAESHPAEPLTEQEIEAIRLLQGDLPLQPRPFDVLTRGTGTGPEDLLTAARSLTARGQLRRFAATVQSRKPGFSASAMGVWIVPDARVEEYAERFVQHRAVSHCHLRTTYPDWPYNLYTTVRARSVDECESVINDLAADFQLSGKQTLFPLKEYRKSGLDLFSPAAGEWERMWGADRAAATG